MALTVNQVISLVAIHSIIHGIAGVFIVSTSFYVNYSTAIISAYLAANASLLILGFLMFCVVVWRSVGLCRFYAVLMVLVVIFNLITGIIYYIEYFPFFANSVFDGYFFYTDTECWVGPDYPVTFWHVITGIVLTMLPLWFVYACLLCKLARILQCCPRPVPCPINPCAPPPTCPPPCPASPCPAPPCPRKRKKIQKYVDEVKCREGRCERSEKWSSKSQQRCCPPPYSPAPSPQSKKTLVLTLKPRI